MTELVKEHTKLSAEETPPIDAHEAAGVDFGVEADDFDQSAATVPMTGKSNIADTKAMEESAAAEMEAVRKAAKAAEQKVADAQAKAEAEASWPHGINPKWDVAQIATTGHVIVARTRRAVAVAFYPVLALGFVAGWGMFHAAQYTSIINPPRALVAALSYDEDSYFDLGGGLHGPAKVRWLADYSPSSQGVSMDDYTALVAAARADLSAHSLDLSNWTAVAGLKNAPKITSPARLLSEFSDRLKSSGAVVVDKDRQLVYAIAHVGGQWGVTILRPSGCTALFGPLVTGCQPSLSPWSPLALDIVSSLKPLEAK